MFIKVHQISEILFHLIILDFIRLLINFIVLIFYTCFFWFCDAFTFQSINILVISNIIIFFDLDLSADVGSHLELIEYFFAV